MKTGAKIAVGILVTLLMLCVIGGILLYSSGALQKITKFAGGVSKIAKTAKSAEALDKTYAFTPPKDGVVPEDRVKAYIAVCDQVKPVSEPYEEWFRTHQGESNNFKDAQDGLKMTSAIMNAYVNALTAQKMSPVEFRWIDAALRKAARDASAAGGSTLERQMLKTLEAQAAKPGLSERDRKELQDKINAFKAKMGQAAKPESPPSPNVDLYERYASQLKACELGDFARSMVLGLGGHRHDHDGVVIRTN